MEKSDTQEERRGILTVGLLCIDMVYFVDHYPVEDSDNRVLEQSCQLGGNASNNACVLNQLNDYSTLLTCICDDVFNPLVLQLLAKSKTSTEGCIIRKGTNTPLSMVMVNGGTGSRTILHYRGHYEELTVEEFDHHIDIEKYSWIHFEGRNIVEVRKMIDFIVDARADSRIPKISVEIEKNRPDIEMLCSGADVVFISKDFAKARGFMDKESAVLGVAETLADVDSVVVCGWAEEGASARLADNTLVCVAAHVPPTVVDTLGAGDCFVAGMVHSLDKGLSVVDALHFACRLAGKKVGQKGLYGLVE